MEKIFYADKSAFTSDEALKKIFSEYYGKDNVAILRTKNGKPYAENLPFFSVSHTKDRLYIAFSDTEIGLDVEHLSRTPRYESVMKKFPPIEQAEIACNEDFLRHWVVKESAVKFLGGTLACDLSKLCYANGTLTYNGAPFPTGVKLIQHEEFILSVCGDGDFENAVFIRLQ